MTRLLILHGANLEAEDFLGSTPLTLACIHGHLGNVQTLLAFGAKVSPSSLRKAVANHHDKIVRELLDKGADSDDRCSKSGKTAILAICARKPTSEQAFSAESNIIRTLHVSGANFKAQDFKGNSIVHLLSKRQWLGASVDRAVHEEALIDQVLEFGADVNARNLDRQSPLLIAAKNLNTLLIRVLICKGADKLSDSEIVRLRLDLEPGAGPRDPMIPARAVKIQQMMQMLQDY